MKWVNWIFLSVVMLCVWLAWEWPTQKSVVVMCDVGQGDAMLITQGFSQILIDTGNEANKLMSCLSQHMPFWDRNLELVVLTHPEIDHMGSFAEIMQGYAVNTLLVSPVGNDTKEFKYIYQTISKSSIKIITAQQGQLMQFGSARLSILWPPPQGSSVWQRDYAYEYQNISNVSIEQKRLLDAENPNELSIVLTIDIDGVKLLLTGDISTQVELALVDKGLIEDVDMLKVAHHGSKTSSQEFFLDRAKPELALISAGKRNRYGHPHPMVLSRLIERNIPISRTDLDGSIQMIFRASEIVTEKHAWLPDWISVSLNQVNL